MKHEHPQVLQTVTREAGTTRGSEDETAQDARSAGNVRVIVRTEDTVAVL